LPTLPLHQELYLLAHDVHGNALIPRRTLSLGLSGAVLLDLMLAGRIVVHAGHPAVQGSAPSGEPVSDTIVLTIAAAPEPRTLVYWIPAVAKDVYDRIAGGLIAAGQLERTAKRRLGVRTAELLAPADPGVRAALRTAVVQTVGGFETARPKLAVLCGLIGVLRLDSALGLEGAPLEVQRRLRELSDARCPEAGQVFDLVNDLSGESAAPAQR
jgi:Golgi phosphoprotein 3 (GPP34)